MKHFFASETYLRVIKQAYLFGGHHLHLIHNTKVVSLDSHNFPEPCFAHCHINNFHKKVMPLPLLMSFLAFSILVLLTNHHPLK